MNTPIVYLILEDDANWIISAIFFSLIVGLHPLPGQSLAWAASMEGHKCFWHMGKLWAGRDEGVRTLNSKLASVLNQECDLGQII